VPGGVDFATGPERRLFVGKIPVAALVTVATQTMRSPGFALIDANQ
jgi:hypothetical protein